MPDSRSTELNHVMVEYMKVRLRSQGYEWTDAPHFANDISCSDAIILDSLLKLSRSLDVDYGSSIAEMVQKAQGKNISDYTAFKTIAEEVFSNEVQWSHFVTLLVFSSSLAFANGVRDRDVDFISSITEWVTRYFIQSEAVKQFLDSRGGWTSLINYADAQHENRYFSLHVLATAALIGLAAAAAYFFK